MCPILKLRAVSQSAKLRIYCTVILPAVMYAEETWHLGTTEMNTLDMRERKIPGPMKACDK
jgi:hypothetical protein